jgi:aromatic-amino-acid transaminase
MFEKLRSQPSDKIMELMALFSQDNRSNKLDLGVGVYKDEKGLTPIMKAVKESEKVLLETQTSKSYVGLLGSIEFCKQITDLVLKNEIEEKRLAFAQTPGGTGALHQLLLLLKSSGFAGTVWISDPTWPNHGAILSHLGLRYEKYSYFNDKTCEVTFQRMQDDINKMNQGDVIILHGCCHNPTGANLDKDQWKFLSKILKEKRIVPLIDLAYQGFGDGLDEDTEGLRLVMNEVQEAMLAVSCSKNFGVYRDRVGAAIVMSENENQKSVAQDNLKSLNRLTFSFPPDHGGAVVSQILKDKALRKLWKEELETMRINMLSLRRNLSHALALATGSDRFNFVERHRGMFSKLGLSEAQVKILREEKGIYMVSDSRINVAGLREEIIENLANAISDVI